MKIILNGPNYKVYFNSYVRGTEITIQKIPKPFGFLKAINLLAILTRVFETVDKQKTKTFPDQSLTLVYRMRM